MDPIIIIFYGALLVVIWLFFIRPQSKKAKEQAKFITELQKGDKVVCSSGIHGKIVKVEDTTFLVEIDNNVKIKIERSGISLDLTQAAYGAADKSAPAKTDETKS